MSMSKILDFQQPAFLPLICAIYGE